MKCKNCNNEMMLDDVDRHSVGNRDKYWVCEYCEIGCTEKIRKDVVTSVTWQED